MPTWIGSLYFYKMQGPCIAEDSLDPFVIFCVSLLGGDKTDSVDRGGEPLAWQWGDSWIMYDNVIL